MAFSPIGVAALSRPSMFADKFIIILPYTGCPLGTSGNILLKKGEMSLERILTAPPISPMRIMPNHKVSTPVRYNDISKPFLAEVNVELTISDIISY